MSFVRRHIPNINISTTKKLFKMCNIETFEQLMRRVGILQNFEYTTKNNNQETVNEEEASKLLTNMMRKNKKNVSLLGTGYVNTTLPNVIKTHVLGNAKWYTPYTPYQAEISQGRLESQYNFQTVVKELTGMPVANASLLDEASAAGEALNLSYGFFKKKRNEFIVSDALHPQILEVLETRAKTLGIKMNFLNLNSCDSVVTTMISDYDLNNCCNFIFQYPNTYGEIIVPFDMLKLVKEYKVLTTGITDLLALTKIVTPAELELDIALGSTQRFGLPLWYGGPHPAFFATTEKLLRYMPGRIIGLSKDNLGDKSYRLALQTREQHIKRERATSNICTSQSLLTNVVAFNVIYNGKKGLEKQYKTIQEKTIYFVEKMRENNIKIIRNTKTDLYFDTLTIKTINALLIVNILMKKGILIRMNKDKTISLTFDETTTYETIDTIVNIIVCLQEYYTYKKGKNGKNEKNENINKHFRKTSFLKDELFTRYTSEQELTRYIFELAEKDYSLTNGIIPLGSCTMKLNATHELAHLMTNEATNAHPFLPDKYVVGYKKLIDCVGKQLKELTGFSAVSFQSNSGATGEYAGLLCIKKYYEKQGSLQRNICLIPNSAHGTNFASASIANMRIKTFDDALLNNLDAFESYIKNFAGDLACLMITYPNTSGVFQKNIEKINAIVHKYGGLVYMDGANMNALTGIFQPERAGFDVCHLNLHKTFCIPHGGGGPGMGPILCNDKLAPYLPKQITLFDNNNNNDNNNDESCGAVAASNYSSAVLLTIPYLYMKTMGLNGLKNAALYAILNANYLKFSLEDDYTILDVNEAGYVGHEFIIDVSEFKKYNITENDIAKRLMDYSFHPPTMSWPRSGVLMFEPTESEPIKELDRLIIAMKQIRQEIHAIETGKSDSKNNLLKNAPHTFKMICDWQFPYTQKEAFYPVESLYENKFHISRGQIDDIYGDKQLLNKNKREK